MCNSRTALQCTKVVKRAGADGGEVSRAADLDRRVLSTLNKMCPENVRNLAEKIKDLDIGTAEELEQVIHQIFKKALKETRCRSSTTPMLWIDHAS